MVSGLAELIKLKGAAGRMVVSLDHGEEEVRSFAGVAVLENGLCGFERRLMKQQGRSVKLSVLLRADSEVLAESSV